MNTKFKKHEKVRLLIDPDPEYTEYDPAYDEQKPSIKKGALGRINVILPNGQYHVEILDENNNTIAYVMIDEDFLESPGSFN